MNKQNDNSVGRAMFLLILTILSIGCASMPSSLEGIRSLPVEDGALQAASRGAGSPTVVFETGAGSSMSVWRPVVERTAPFVATFAYNRPGYGTSRSRRSPRSGRDVVDRLRQGLRAAGHSPPYVLVGHSLGGLYMNLFARTYPREVAGVVLVDSSHPRQFEIFRERMPWAHSMLLASYGAGPPNRRYELETMKRARDEIDAAAPFPPIPLVVLTAGKAAAWENEKSRALWLELQADLTAMSPFGRQVIAERSGHFIQRNDPELVAESIREVLAAARVAGAGKSE